jgi:hypothetical protein
MRFTSSTSHHGRKIASVKYIETKGNNNINNINDKHKENKKKKVSKMAVAVVDCIIRYSHNKLHALPIYEQVKGLVLFLLPLTRGHQQQHNKSSGMQQQQQQQ